jgi:hypothetical protein
MERIASRVHVRQQQPSFQSYIPSPIPPQLLHPFLAPPLPLRAPSESTFVRTFTIVMAGGNCKSNSDASAGECARVREKRETLTGTSGEIIFPVLTQ